MSSVLAIPAPVRGWDVKTALADMDEDAASVLDNWFPGVGRVDIRPGYTSYATGLEGNVETLAEFINGSNRKFLAFANNKIWNITAAGAAVDITNSMTITSNRWDWVNFDGKMGLVNGADAPLQIATDGTTASTLTLTGPTAANVIGVHAFSGRTYWWEDDSQSFWYSAVNTLGGTLTEFQLGRIGNFGGKLVKMESWLRDGGAGVDDLAVFFMSSGEVIVYSGTDPASFSLVGVFYLGSLVSARSVIKYAGDIVAVTSDGYISLNGAISQGRVSERGLLSDQINPAVTDEIEENAQNWGWEAFLYPAGNMLMFNIPRATNTTYDQHVFNTNTGAPCRFKRINARTWGLYNDEAYFGGSGVVYKFDDGYDDAGVNIDADAVPGCTYLNSRARNKHVVAVQPVTSSDGRVAVACDVAADFKVPNVAYENPTFEGGASDWDTADWDDAAWSSGGFITQDWKHITSYGYNFRARVRVRTKGQLVKWYSTNYMFENGGLV